MEKLHPKWEKATKELISKLEDCGINFENYNTIELFGREGSWQTKLFANKVKNLEVWEIDNSFEKKLRENLPKSEVKIVDSIKTLQENKNFPAYDLILIDNPNNTYGLNGTYCEHFDILKNIKKLIHNRALIIFNVNRKPFNYEEFPKWRKRRDEFYGTKKTEDMSITNLLKFYEEFFDNLGLKTIFSINVVRVLFDGIDTNHYFAFLLTR